MRGRRASRITTICGSILLFLAILAGLINRHVLDGDRFAAGIDGMRREPAVARQVGQALANRLFDAVPDLIAVRPLVEGAATSLAGSSAFSSVFRAAARQTHRAFTDERKGQVSLRLVDVGATFVGVLRVIAPQTASRLPANLDVTLAHVGSQSWAADTIHLTRTARLLAWLLPLLAVLTLAAGVWLSPDWLEGTARLGWGIAAAGAGVAVLAAAGTIAASSVDEGTLHGALVAAAWRHFGTVLWWPAGITVASGGLLAAVASGRLPRWDLAAIARRIWTLASGTPGRRGTRIIRGAGIALLGLAAAAWSDFVFRAVAALIALTLVVVGLSEVSAAIEERTRVSRGQSSRRRPVLAVAVAVLAVLTLLGVEAAPVDTTVSPVANATVAACNGHVELCSRRYDDVAFPATHNAMAAADEPGWFIPEQPTGMIGQLNAGIRVLLIDAWYGQRTQRRGVIATAPASHQAALDMAEREFGSQVVQSALRVRDAITTTPTGPVEPYLCHGLCEIGATKWEPVMADVQRWLKSHPREVITFFIEDYVSPQDTEAVFKKAGLLPYLHVQQQGKPWPTLGQMIDSGHRVVVLIEKHTAGASSPWMLQGFDWVQDTPFSNPNVASLSCARNRGAPSNRLFLVNYWLSNFHSLVSDARRVNAYSVLWPYLVKCQIQRDRLPNFVAVNYYNEGDLFRAVDQLNGLGRP